MLKLFLPSLLIVFSVFSVAQQTHNQTKHFISDDLYTYMHSGPGKNYRILGSVQAGSEVQVKNQNSENNFTQITDSRGRTGWVESQFVTNEASVRHRVPGLEAQLQQSGAELTDLLAEKSKLTQQVQQLTRHNQKLDTDMKRLEQDNRQLNQQLSEQDQTAQLAWLTRGGLIALGGIVLGVIIAYLPKKRKRNDQWM